jgi:hypothetical protein
MLCVDDKQTIVQGRGFVNKIIIPLGKISVDSLITWYFRCGCTKRIPSSPCLLESLKATLETYRDYAPHIFAVRPRRDIAFGTVPSFGDLSKALLKD